MHRILVETPNDPAILEGVKSGIYKVTGGVIRETNTGQIVAHMREVGDTVNIASALGGSPILPYLNLGIGVLTLSAVVASTIYLSRKLSQISEKLDRIFEEIRAIKNDVELIKAIEVYTDLKKGLMFTDEYIRDPERYKRFLEDRAITLRRAIATLDTYLTFAQAKLFNKDNLEVITEPLKLYMLAYSAYCNALLELDEIEQAKVEYDRAYARVKELCSFLFNETLPHQAVHLKPVKIDAERFWGYKKETETMLKLEIPYSEWKGLTSDKSDGLYILKVPAKV